MERAEEEEEEKEEDAEDSESSEEEDGSSEDDSDSVLFEEPVPVPANTNDPTQPTTENAKDMGSEKQSNPQEKDPSMDSDPPTHGDTETTPVDRVAERLGAVNMQDTSSAEPDSGQSCATPSAGLRNNPNMLTGDELISFLKGLHVGPTYTEGVTTLGLVS